MQRSSTAPWGRKKSSLGQKFRKRNIERFKVIKSISDRRDRVERKASAYSWRSDQEQEYEDA